MSAVVKEYSTPAPSLCGMTGPSSSRPGTEPTRFLTSDGLTPLAASCTRTSPGPGRGRSNSPTVSTSRAKPKDLNQAAFKVDPVLSFVNPRHWTLIRFGRQRSWPGRRCSRPDRKPNYWGQGKKPESIGKEVGILEKADRVDGLFGSAAINPPPRPGPGRHRR